MKLLPQNKFSYILLALCLFLTPSALTVYGFCFSEGKFLSKNEFIRASAEHINSRQWIGGGPNGEARKVIPYPNVDAFLAANSGCCRINEKGPYELHQATLVDGLNGRVAARLRAEYLINYLADDNSKKVVRVKEENYLSNCGEPYQRYGGNVIQQGD